jgi:predicted nucleic acid-binding protein
LKAADTSVVIAAFASWHEHHDRARHALDRGLRLIDHCALESFSVLTRLPPPHRSAADVVLEFLTARFPQPWLRLSATAYKAFIPGLASRGVAGGASYDALVAATAASCDAELVSCDRRALTIYERYGVRTTLLA